MRFTKKIQVQLIGNYRDMFFFQYANLSSLFQVYYLKSLFFPFSLFSLYISLTDQKSTTSLFSLSLSLTNQESFCVGGFSCGCVIMRSFWDLRVQDTKMWMLKVTWLDESESPVAKSNTSSTMSPPGWTFITNFSFSNCDRFVLFFL